MSIAATREFFGSRAAGWEDSFPDDGSRFERAMRALDPAVGGTVLDAACGTGRALPYLRAAVGPTGRVVGVDLTVEMLTEALRRGRGDPAVAALVLADVTRLPLADGTVDAILAAGLISHLADPVAGLRELARVGRPGARLALFHPIGRATLARRHGHEVDPDDIRGEARIRAALGAAGWQCESVDDGPKRYLVLAVRGAD
jgi:SAM-dependent methyltransferase